MVRSGTRSGKNYLTANTTRNTAAVPAEASSSGSLARQNSSSTEEGSDSVASSILPETPRRPATPAKSVKSLKSPSSARSARTLNPLRTNKRGLGEPAQEALLEELEKSGFEVVHNHRDGVAGWVQDVVDRTEKTDLFGKEKKTKLRLSTCNKVREWIKLPKDQYAQLLKHFSVTPHLFRQPSSPQQHKASSQQEPATPSKVSQSHQAASARSKGKAKSSSSRVPSHQAKSTKQQKPPAYIEVSGDYRELERSYSSDDQDSTDHTIMADIKRSDDELVAEQVRLGAVVLEVHDNKPYEHGLYRLEIVPFVHDDTGSKKEFRGWDIRLTIDARDFKERKVHAKKLGSKYVLISQPLERRSSHSNVDVGQAEKKEAAYPGIVKGHQIARKAYATKVPDAEKVGRIVLRFYAHDKSKGIELSNEFFRATGGTFLGDPNIDLHPHKIPTASKTGAKIKAADGTKADQIQVTTTISWKVVNLKTEEEYGGIAKAKEADDEEDFDIAGIDLDADDVATRRAAARKGGAPDPPSSETPAPAPGSLTPAPAPGSLTPAPAPGSLTPAPAPGSLVTTPAPAPAPDSPSLGSMSVSSESELDSDVSFEDSALAKKIDSLVNESGEDLNTIVQQLKGKKRRVIKEKNKRKEPPTSGGGKTEEPGVFPKFITTDNPEYMVSQLSTGYQLELSRIKQELGVDQRDKRLNQILNELVDLLLPVQQAEIKNAGNTVARKFELLATFSRQNAKAKDIENVD